jgi:hypothetical protein
MALSESTASSRAAPQDQARDVQTLISLLGDMVPLLLRMQSPTVGQVSPLWPNDLILNPMLDHQAAVSFVENIAADSLQTLSTYLEGRSPQAAELDICKPIVTQAANCLAVHDYAQTLNLIWQAYRLVTALRAVNPQLPPLRSASATQAASPDRSSTQH